MNLAHRAGGRRSGAARRCAAAVAGLAAAALALPSAAAAQAPTLYVDAASAGGSCSDARTAAENTLATPWCSLDRALAAAPAGSTVELRRGMYGPITSADVSRSAYVTFTSYPGERPTVAGMDLSRVDHLRFERLLFTGDVIVRTGSDVQFVRNESALTPAGSQTASGYVIMDVRRALFEGNWIHDGRDAINLSGRTRPSSDVVIRGNHFQRMGNDGVHITAGSTRVLVTGNDFDDVKLRTDVDPEAHADAIQATGSTYDVTAAGNLVRGGRGFLFMVSPTHQDKPGRGHFGLTLANNVFLGGDFGIRTFSTPGARILNNTVWGRAISETSGIHINDRVGDFNERSSGMVLANNVIKRLKVDPGVGFAHRDHNVIDAGPVAGSHDVIAAPAFVSPSTGDYRLRPGTVGVDAAEPAVAPAVDYAGRRRGDRPDVGALEAGTGTYDVVGGAGEQGEMPAPPPAADPPASEPAPPAPAQGTPAPAHPAPAPAPPAPASPAPAPPQQPQAAPKPGKATPAPAPGKPAQAPDARPVPAPRPTGPAQPGTSPGSRPPVASAATAVRPLADTDFDGVRDTLDGDDDGDGVRDPLDFDRDNDGMTDARDRDDDNDGIHDRRDRDDDNDGIHDRRDRDDDNDGVADARDRDDDNDGIHDRRDRDDDNDGVADARDRDFDNDGVRDRRDRDDDGDGIRDARDRDRDNDGRRDGRR